MPTSAPHNISRVLDIVLSLRPRSVLDIGVGTGKYGFLLREYLDMWVYGDGSTWPPRRVARIDGIEGCEKYIGEVQRSVYDHIYVGNALDILPSWAALSTTWSC